MSSPEEEPAVEGAEDAGQQRSWEAELFVERRAVRRGKLVAIFLLINWAIMGWFTVRAPSIWFVLFTATLGLVALIGGLSQWRAARRAAEVPLVRWDRDLLELRPYTRLQWMGVPWQRMKLFSGKLPSTTSPSGEGVDVGVEDDRVVFLGWPEPSAAPEALEAPGGEDVAPRAILGLSILAEADRRRLLETLRRRATS